MLITVIGDNAVTVAEELPDTIVSSGTVAVQEQTTPAVVDGAMVVVTEAPKVQQVDESDTEIVVQTVSTASLRRMFLMDHNYLYGLDGDDHPQYYNSVRGHAAFTPLSHIQTDGNAHNLHAAQLPGLSNWATYTTAIDQAFIEANMAAGAIGSTQIASIAAGKIATGTIASVLSFSDLFTASSTGSVINSSGVGLSVGQGRIQMGYTDSVLEDYSYILRHYNGYEDNHPSYVSNFNIREDGTVFMAGTLSIVSGSGIANLTDAGALATRNKISFYQDTQPLDAESIAGDLWYDTSDGNKPHRYTGIYWVDISDGQIAIIQGALDGRIQSYFTEIEPTGLTETDNGDIWFKTSGGVVVGTYYYNDAAVPKWQDATDSGIAQGIADAASAQATADGKITTYTLADFPSSVEGLGDLVYHTGDKLLYRAIRFPIQTLYDPLDWAVVSNNFDDTGELTDGAGLGTTADWDGVSGVAKPADYADVTDVGGANYVLRGFTPPNNQSGALTEGVAGKGNWSFIIPDTTGLTHVMTFGMPDLELSTQYVLSFKVTSTLSSIGTPTEFDTGFTSGLVTQTHTLTSGVVPTRYEILVSSDVVGFATADLLFVRTNTHLNPTDVVTIYDVKLERGTQATDWTPYNPITDKADGTKEIMETGVDITGGGIILNDNGVNGASIRTVNKTSYADDTAGIYIGWDAVVADYVFNMGNGLQSIKWDGANLNITGSITVAWGDILSAPTTLTELNATEGATLDTVASWKHPTDVTKIDGSSISTNTITADRFETTLEGDLNQALYFVKTILSAGDEYSYTLTQTEFDTDSHPGLDAHYHADYGFSIRIITTQTWDGIGDVWDGGNTWDIPNVGTGTYTSLSRDLTSVKNLQMAYDADVYYDDLATATILVEVIYSLDNISWGTNEGSLNNNIWEVCTPKAVTATRVRWSGDLHSSRYFRFRVTLTTSDTTKNIYLVNPKYLGNIVNVYGFFASKAIASGGTDFVITGYNAPPAVTATSVGATAITCSVYNITTTGFRVRTYNAAGADVAATVNIIIMGA